jgi:hypothetical protein
MKWLAPVFGVSSVSPLVIAQSVGGSNAEPVTWLTGGVVVAIATAFYRFMAQRIQKLEAQVDELTKAAERRAEEDRKLLIPLLSESVSAQAAYLSRRLGGGEENRP